MVSSASGVLSPLFVSSPALLDYQLAKMEDVRITARDGLELVAYLTRADTEKATPMALLHSSHTRAPMSFPSRHSLSPITRDDHQSSDHNHHP